MRSQWWDPSSTGSVFLWKETSQSSWAPTPAQRGGGQSNTVNPGRGIRLCKRGRRTTSLDPSMPAPDHACTWLWTSPASRTVRNLLFNPRRLYTWLQQAQQTGTLEQKEAENRSGTSSSGRSSHTRRYSTPLGQLCGCIGAAPKKAVTKTTPPAELLSTWPSKERLLQTHSYLIYLGIFTSNSYTLLSSLELHIVHSKGQYL